MGAFVVPGDLNTFTQGEASAEGFGAQGPGKLRNARLR